MPNQKEKPKSRRTDWSVDGQAGLRNRSAMSELVMAWARDRGTGEPRYILELEEHQRGAQCNCECVSCGGSLIAVNAARDTFRRRPHFRHVDGTEKHSCLVLAARTALLATLGSTGYLDLPSRRRTARVAGISGEFHDAWFDAPAERVHIASCVFSDEADVIVTLEDGRELQAILVGRHGDVADNRPHAVIEILVDDPALAAMSPEELRQRTRLLVGKARWCGHWQDSVLDEMAVAAAREHAVLAFDFAEDTKGLAGATPQQARETLLHRKAKEILEREKRIMVPEMTLTERVQRVIGNKTVTRKVRESRMMELRSVALELRTGHIIPDVTATTLPQPGWPAETLLVEITVWSGIDVSRRMRIWEEGLPTIEIDLSRLGGKVTEEELTRLIVDELVCKRWVYHPAIEAEREKFNAELAAAEEATRPTRQAPPEQHRPPRYPDNSRSARNSSPRYVERTRDLWLKGEDLERWKRENPESAAMWFGTDDKIIK